MTAALSPSEERHLYATDRPAWLRYVAPRMAAQLTAENDEALGRRWAALPRDYQCAVWRLLDVATQRRIREARVAAFTTEGVDL